MQYWSRQRWHSWGCSIWHDFCNIWNNIYSHCAHTCVACSCLVLCRYWRCIYISPCCQLVYSVELVSFYCDGVVGWVLLFGLLLRRSDKSGCWLHPSSPRSSPFLASILSSSTINPSPRSASWRGAETNSPKTPPPLSAHAAIRSLHWDLYRACQHRRTHCCDIPNATRSLKEWIECYTICSVCFSELSEDSVPSV